jgi:lysozyme
MPDTIDVFQKYQVSVNWTQVHAAGVRRVFVKLTNGAATAAPAGDGYVNGAHSAGLTVGGYAYALGGDPLAQAEVFAGELLRMPNALALAPALDFEDPSLPTSTVAQRTWITTFFTRLRARIPTLTKVLLYSSGSALAAMTAGSIAVPGLQVLIWDAESGPNDGRVHPAVHYNGAVAVHQYTSVGTVPGVAGKVDEDTTDTDITEGSTMTDPNAKPLDRQNPVYDGSTLAGQVTVEAMAQRFDNAMEQQSKRDGQILTELAAVKTELDALKVSQAPAGTLSGDATVTVHLAPAQQ